jgi:hypothetical protein
VAVAGLDVSSGSSITLPRPQRYASAMKHLIVTAALLATAACAHAPAPMAGLATELPERELLTGSRIPQRLDATGTFGIGAQPVRVYRYRPGAEPDLARMLRQADPSLRIGIGG